MIKVDRKNHICELHGDSDEILLDVQLVLHVKQFTMLP